MAYQNVPKVLVLGDIMLDKYTLGDVSRISPEAPIPVLEQKKINYILGGAANVANNLLSLGSRVCVASVIGTDEIGQRLKALLENSGMDCSLSVVSDKYCSICKERIVAKSQQVIRVDYNDRLRPSEDILKQLLENCASCINEFDAVVISDYNKGVCTDNVCKEIIHFCRVNSVPVIVDPKGTNWEKYRGATTITPNLREISMYLGREIENDDADVERALCCTYDQLGIDYLLVTRSEKGMSLIDSKKLTLHLRAEAREVYDVSGAGDTVVATLANFWNRVATVDEAVRLSNIAAGVVVRKFGTATVTQEEIYLAASSKPYDYEARVYSVDMLPLLSEKVKIWRTHGDTIVTTNGCFDILHIGHIKMLTEAKKLGTRLIVGLNSDASVRRLKGANRPLNGEYDRAILLAALEVVDIVAIFDEPIQSLSGNTECDVPFTLLKTIKPDVHVKGGDYSADQVPEARFANRFVSVPYVEGYSTTGVFDKMNSNE